MIGDLRKKMLSQSKDYHEVGCPIACASAGHPSSQLVPQGIIPKTKLLFSKYELPLLTEFRLLLLRYSAVYRQLGHSFHIHSTCCQNCRPIRRSGCRDAEPSTLLPRVYRLLVVYYWFHPFEVAIMCPGLVFGLCSLYYFKFKFI